MPHGTVRSTPQRSQNMNYAKSSRLWYARKENSETTQLSASDETDCWFSSWRITSNLGHTAIDHSRFHGFTRTQGRRRKRVGGASRCSSLSSVCPSQAWLPRKSRQSSGTQRWLNECPVIHGCKRTARVVAHRATNWSWIYWWHWECEGSCS